MLVVLSCVVPFFCWYAFLSQILPFDLPFDMDVITANDVLLINSGQYPLHIDHPKFGMHLLTSAGVALSRWGQMISVANFADLSQSPSPLLCIAELILFLRRFEAGFVWLLLVLALTSLWSLFPRQRLLWLLAVPLLGLQTGLIYSAMVLRTEAFSVFFLLLGLCVFCGLYRLARYSHRLAPEIAAWLLTGFCFGLAQLTKLQAIIAAPLLLAICLYVYLQPPAENPSPVPELPQTFHRPIQLLFGLGALIWLGLAVLAWRQPLLPGMAPKLIPLADFETGQLSLMALLSHLKLQLLWLLLLSSAALSPLASRWLGRWPALQRSARLYPLFWLGLFTAFAAPMAVYIAQPQGLSHGWTYLLQMTQSCLWTDTNATTNGSAGNLLTTLSYVWIAERPYLWLAVAALVLALYALRTRTQPGHKPAQIAALLVFLTGAVALLACSRGNLRDAIWYQFLGNLSLMILIQQTWTLYGTRRLMRVLLSLSVLLPAGLSAWELPLTLDQVYLYFSRQKSYRYSTLISADYATPEMAYPQTMMDAYGRYSYPPDGPLPPDERYLFPPPGSPQAQDRDLVRRAVAQARLLEPLRKLADLHFINRRLPVSALGLASPRFPVWRQNGAWVRFKSLPPELEGSLLINPAFATDAKRPSWIDTAWDSDLLLCIAGKDYRRLFGIAPPKTEQPVRLSQGDITLDYYPIAIKGDYSREGIGKAIPYFSRFSTGWLEQLGTPAFFLLRNGQGWGTEYPNWSNLEALLSGSAAPAN